MWCGFINKNHKICKLPNSLSLSLCFFLSFSLSCFIIYVSVYTYIIPYMAPQALFQTICLSTGILYDQEHTIACCSNRISCSLSRRIKHKINIKIIFYLKKHIFFLDLRVSHGQNDYFHFIALTVLYVQLINNFVLQRFSYIVINYAVHFKHTDTAIGSATKKSNYIILKHHAETKKNKIKNVQSHVAQTQVSFIFLARTLYSLSARTITIFCQGYS